METKIRELIDKYEKYLEMDDNTEEDAYRKGANDELFAVIQDLKDVLSV